MFRGREVRAVLVTCTDSTQSPLKKGKSYLALKAFKTIGGVNYLELMEFSQDQPFLAHRFEPGLGTKIEAFIELQIAACLSGSYRGNK